MRVLGVTPSSSEVYWALAEGTRSTPRIAPLETIKQKFPKTQSETQTLHDLYRFSVSFLEEQSVEKVYILQAGNNRFGKTSSLRIKAEAAFQLACAEKNIPVEIIPPQTLRSQEKKFQSEAGDTLEQIFNGGKDFKPKTWKDAVVVAWMGLEA